MRSTVVSSLSAAAAKKWGSRTFAATETDSLTYRELDDWARIVASRFLDAGVKPGQHVLIFLPNRLEALVAAAAAWRIAAIPAPVVAIYRSRELEHIAKDVSPAVVVTQEAFSDRSLVADLDAALESAGVSPRLKLVLDVGPDQGRSDGWAPFPGIDSAAPSEDIDWPEFASPADECLRLFTSGTTSAPKGARLSSKTVIGSALQFREAFDLNESDVGLALAPVTHLAGFLAAFTVPLTIGARAVVMPKWNVEHALTLIDRNQVTWSLGAAVFLLDMVTAYEQTNEELHVLKYFVSGGASTPPALVERADAIGMKAVRAYGMTETAGPVTISPGNAPLAQRARWDGFVLTGIEVRVVDDVGNEVEPGVEGNLQLRGDRVMIGYSDLAANERQFVDGWFDPGDVGFVTKEGWVQITGRTKDIINRGGEKMSAREIEEVILAHPAIADAVVLGVPHPRLGESVCAYVTLKSNMERPTEDELNAFVAAQGLARAKTPAEWHIADSLPRSASGKVQKHILRKRHLNSKEADPQPTPV